MKITVNSKYLVFPVNSRLSKKRLTFSIDGNIVYELNIKLDNTNPDFYAYIDISRFNGKELDINIFPEMKLCFTEDNAMPSEDIYKEPLRPQIHFTAKNGWLNDPNGLIYVDGKYHMFYQHNPCEADWENMHWGHAVSEDMLHWEEKDIALFPDSTGKMYSGSAMLDEKNLLGFNVGDKPAVLLFYTATSPYSQHIAYSTDNLETIHKYENNPVVPHITRGNRDPSVVFCREIDAYVMALYLTENFYGILISKDLKNWEKVQEVYLPDDSECPDIFPISTANGTRKWVIMGAKDTYLVGDFSGNCFVQCQDHKKLHFGNSSYAGQTISNMPCGRTVRMVWDRGGLRTTAFSSQMMMPYDLELEEINGVYYLSAKPIKEIDSLAVCKSKYENLLIDKDAPQKFCLNNKPHIIKLCGKIKAGTKLDFNLFGYRFLCDLAERKLKYKSFSAPLADFSDDYELTVITDTSSIELYCNGGKAYITDSTAFSDYNLSYLHISSNTDCTVEKLEITELESVWHK